MTDTRGVTARANGVLAATCLSTLVVNANTSAVSILLPAISDDTGTSVDTLQWAVTGYSLVGAAVIVTAGSLGDVFGRRRVFQLGLALFVVSCVFIGLSSSGGAVIAGRFIQGAAGSTILACGLSLLTVANSGAEQLRAVSLWGAAAAVGAAAGPLIGGVLVDVTGWQGLFWIDAVVGLVCMVITRRSVEESGTEPVSLDRLHRQRAHRPDPRAPHPRPQQGQLLGLGVGRDDRLPGRGRPRRRRLRDGREARRRAPARPGPPAQPGARGLHGGDPHRGGHDQRPDVRAEPVVPGPELARVHPPPGGAGDAAGDRRPRRRWHPSCRSSPPGWGARQVVGPGVRDHRGRVRRHRLADADWLYRAFVIPLIADRRRDGMSNGPASSASTACVPVEPGRVGLRGVQHGALRRRGRGDRAGRHRSTARHRHRTADGSPPARRSPPGCRPPPG